ncbi:hypothetical protein ACJDUG_08605 [Clostridium sp. WILCCON 0185]|uniref:Uncharacterized protein n=1 Tax=Candidatus Clostridium stratigraminis TaxID=3381661 RepID=A0ABW8T4L5_9CLOT
MRNYKIIRNIYIFCGLCFLIATILQLKAYKFVLVPILDGISCILCFITAYINHKNICKNDKEYDK